MARLRWQRIGIAKGFALNLNRGSLLVLPGSGVQVCLCSCTVEKEADRKTSGELAKCFEKEKHFRCSISSLLLEEAAYLDLLCLSHVFHDTGACARFVSDCVKQGKIQGREAQGSNTGSGSLQASLLTFAGEMNPWCWCWSNIPSPSLTAAGSETTAGLLLTIYNFLVKPLPPFCHRLLQDEFAAAALARINSAPCTSQQPGQN